MRKIRVDTGPTVSASAASNKLQVRNAAQNLARASAASERKLTFEDIPHLFERFWQKDTARSLVKHSGLGLPLARAYAESLGMKLEAELKHPEIIFTLSRASPCDGLAHV